MLEPVVLRCENQRPSLEAVQQLALGTPHRLHLEVHAELHHVDHQRRGELHLRAVTEEDERGPERQLEEHLDAGEVVGVLLVGGKEDGEGLVDEIALLVKEQVAPDVEQAGDEQRGPEREAREDQDRRGEKCKPLRIVADLWGQEDVGA